VESGVFAIVRARMSSKAAWICRRIDGDLDGPREWGTCALAVKRRRWEANIRFGGCGGEAWLPRRKMSAGYVGRR